MRSSIPLLTTLTLTLATLSTAKTNTENDKICGQRSPSIMHAIGQFCQKTDIVVPSDYAIHGAHGLYDDPNTYTHIFITANCDPPQWVPQEYCFSQFKELCANSQDKTFSGVEYFGRQDCQRWHIENGVLGSGPQRAGE
ncbi:hypothetical protein LTR86_001152 [Recurvomyces mirabilis]|nr:hypothetical protein LTR86_001152 [Recurvomyces mirabilis]